MGRSDQPREGRRKSQPGEDPRIPVEVRSYFVRGRNALVARAAFGSLYEDYYLHLLQHGIRHEPESDQLLKDTLAAVTLHLAARPRNENAAWTIHIREPLSNLFVAGSNHRQTVTGRLFEPEGKRDDANLFSNQSTVDGGEPRQSTIDFQAGDVFTGAEAYYRRSEQRPARYFRIGPEEFVLVAAQPDCDLEWFGSLDNEAIAVLDQEEQLSLLERRFYHFDCGCEIERIHRLFLSCDNEALDNVFENDPSLAIACPRCAARFVVTREALDDYLAEHRDGNARE